MRLIDDVKFVVGCAPAALTSTAGDGDYVSMKNYGRLTIVLLVDNATTVTGGTITLKQSTAVGGADQALAFTKMWANTDVGASDTLVETAVTNNTFTTATTNDKNLMYVIEVDATDLDVADGYDCVRLDSTGMANAVGSVLYILSECKEKPAIAVSAITD